jgi:hypothetical protein
MTSVAISPCRSLLAITDALLATPVIKHGPVVDAQQMTDPLQRRRGGQAQLGE